MAKRYRDSKERHYSKLIAQKNADAKYTDMCGSRLDDKTMALLRKKPYQYRKMG